MTRLLARWAVPLAIVVLAGCSRPEPPRWTSAADHFSIAELPGWTATAERGSVVFRTPEQTGIMASIAIRSVPVNGDWVEKRTPALVVPATERALQGLPEAQVARVGDVSRTGFSGSSYRVSILGSEGSQRYDRLHTVLVGQRRVIHVALTAPEGELDSATRAYDSVISSIREEG